MWNLLKQELRNRRNGMIGWGVGLGLLGLIEVLLFPSVADMFAGIKLPDFYQFFGDLSNLNTLAGFMGVEMFGLMPVIIGIYAIIVGTGTLAGEEDAGTLEMLLALPLPRWQLVLVKAVAVAITMIVILLFVSLGSLIGFFAIQGKLELTENPLDMVIAFLDMLPILLLWSWMSMLFGAIMPARRHASALMAIVMVEGYFLNAFARLVEKLEPYQFISPFYYYSGQEVMEGNWDKSDSMVLLAVSFVCLLLTIVAFQWRDITVGAWPWQRLLTNRKHA